MEMFIGIYLTVFFMLVGIPQIKEVRQMDRTSQLFNPIGVSSYQRLFQISVAWVLFGMVSGHFWMWFPGYVNALISRLILSYINSEKDAFQILLNKPILDNSNQVDAMHELGTGEHLHKNSTQRFDNSPLMNSFLAEQSRIVK